jgi:hypothetical protein
VSKEITISYPGLEVRIVIFDISSFVSIAKAAGRRASPATDWDLVEVEGF